VFAKPEPRCEIAPTVVGDDVADAFLAWTAAFFGARTVDTVTVLASGAAVVGGVALTCLLPLEHAPASANAPQTTTTVRTPDLPIAEAYAKKGVGWRGRPGRDQTEIETTRLSLPPSSSVTIRVTAYTPDER
jgi:hypothetical protein